MESNMRLTDYEHYFPSKILKRGFNYYIDGHVEDLDKINATTWRADVAGSNSIYEVEIKIKNDRTIDYMICECPYDGDCKHIVATLYAIEEQIKRIDIPIAAAVKKEKKKNLKRLLQTQTKEQLLELVLHISDTHPKVKTELEMRFAPPEDELEKAKQLIKEHLSAVQDCSGFIHWRDVSKGLYGIDLVLQQAEQALSLQKPMQALQLALLSFRSALDVISYADDSSGEIGDQIYTSIDLLANIIMEGMEIWDATEEQQVFALFIKESSNRQLSGWPNLKIDLLNLCLPLTINNDIEAQLISYLHELKKEDDDWCSRYEQTELLKLEHAILSLKKGATAAGDFLQQHSDNDDIRKLIIEQALSDQEYEKALTLAKEGIQKTSNSGYISDYLQYRYQAFEALGNVLELQQIGANLATNGKLEYYQKLKNLYSELEWETVCENILDNLKENRTYDYFLLIQEEKHLPRLLQYCNTSPSAIVELAKILHPVYPEQVQKLFSQFIRESAKTAASRNKYYNIAQYIKKFRALGYEKEAVTIAEQLLTQYPKRTAMRDEFKKHL